MNGVNAAGVARGWPATAILRLNSKLPVVVSSERNADTEAALVAAVAFPPRVGEVRPIAALLPEVLARYGLAESDKQSGINSIDCLA